MKYLTYSEAGFNIVESNINDIEEFTQTVDYDNIHVLDYLNNIDLKIVNRVKELI